MDRKTHTYQNTLSEFPNLILEWNFEKNGCLIPEEIRVNSNKKVWWICNKGHEWEANVSSRTRNKTGCPYCSGNKVLTGFNDLATTNPLVLAEWDYEKNKITPQEVSKGSSIKVWWVCSKGHSYSSSIGLHVLRKRGCPYCHGTKVLSGFNDLLSQNPELAKEWNYEKNGTITPDTIGAFSKKKVWWKGECGHEWEASPANRMHSKTIGKCPICLNRTIIQGINDLCTTDPELAKEWHPTKNGKLTPSQVTIGYAKKVWWKGECGHEWHVAPTNRRNTDSKQSKYTRCPVCQNKSEIIDYKNSIQKNFPELASEWHPIKNGALIPEDVSYGSSRKVWWKGKCGHEWQASITSRVKGTNCPYCAGRKVLSGFNDLKSQYPLIANEWDYEKNTISPDSITSGSHKKAWWICPKGHSYTTSVYARTKLFTDCPYCIAKNTSYPEQFIYWLLKGIYPATSNRIHIDGYEFDVYSPERSLYIEYSGKYWHKDKEERSNEKRRVAEKNEGQFYEIIDDHSVKGILQKNNSFILNASVKPEEQLIEILKRIMPESILQIDAIDIDEIKEKAIEYSKGKIEEHKSLSFLYPDLSEEWCYERNNGLTPFDITPGSKIIVWWICPNSHFYQASCNRRTSMGSGCPICARKKVTKGVSDLKTVSPHIAAQWNYMKNGVLRPEDVSSGSGKKVWWICSQGHEWKATIKSRGVVGCPICSRERATNKTRKPAELFVNQVAEKCPDVEVIGHYINNTTSVLCKCKACGNEWMANPRSLMRSSQCPKCSYLRRANDHKKAHTQFIHELYEINPNIEITGSYENANTRLRCKCLVCGNEWMAQPHNLLHNHGCPRCAKKRLVVGLNDLLTTHPDIAAEWDYEKNDLMPTEITKSSKKQVWWKCKNGHEWKAAVVSRTVHCTKCPKCEDTLRKRAVICIETGQIYGSATDAKRKTGIDNSAISKCVRGLANTAGGFHWKYAEC